MKAYETPEITEIGDASALTLGATTSPYVDGCECSKHKDDTVGER